MLSSKPRPRLPNRPVTKAELVNLTGTLVPDQLGQTWTLGQNITLQWYLPPGVSVGEVQPPSLYSWPPTATMPAGSPLSADGTCASAVYPLQYTDSIQNAYQALSSGCPAPQPGGSVCCTSTSYTLAHNSSSLDKYSLGSPSQAFQGTFTVSTSAGTDSGPHTADVQ